MKNTKHNSWQPVPEQHYKKPYLIRKAEETEAEDEIERYERLSGDYPTNDSDDAPSSSSW